MTFADRTIDEFLATVASSQVAPSAGAVTAVNGAMATALCEMVCVHTGDEATSAALSAAHEELTARRERLLELADEDGEAVDRVQTAFEADADETHEQAALQRATEVPLRIAETCLDVVQHAVVVAEDGTQNALVDAVVGAKLAYAALDASLEIARTNLHLIEDEEFAEEVRTRAEQAETAGEAARSDAVEQLSI